MCVLGKKVNRNLSQGSYESIIVGRKSPLNVLKLLEGLVGSERKAYK